MIGDSLYRLGVLPNDTVNNVENTIFNIVTEGPVRSILHLATTTGTPMAPIAPIALEEQPAIWPGMCAYRNTAKISGLQVDELLLVGMNNLDTTDSLKEIPVNDKWVVLLT